MTNIESIGCEADARSVRDEEAAVVHEEIGRLPERYRRAVVLCHFEGLTHAEAARRLGWRQAPSARSFREPRPAPHPARTPRIFCGCTRARRFARAQDSNGGRSSVARASHGPGRPLLRDQGAAVAGIVSKPVVELASGALSAMKLSKLAIAATCLAALGVAVAAGGLATAMPRAAERAPRPQVRENTRNAQPKVAAPSLPVAVTQPPTWLVNNSPFDVAAFFAALPPEENAAPRYLEALFQFGPEVDVCFPDGADRESRKKTVEQRLARFWPVFQSWSKDPSTVAAGAIDAVVSEFDTGFRKLDWAQQRPRCVFQTGVGMTAQIPHVRVVGQVARMRD